MPSKPADATKVPTDDQGATQGLNYATSGDLSSVFIHTQNAYISYEQVSISRPTGNWPPATETAPKFQCYLTYTVNETLQDWNPSGTIDWTSSATSGAASGTELNSYQCGSATVFSFDSSTGLGTSGYVQFGTGRYSRLATNADYEYVKGNGFNDILITTPLGLATSGTALGDDQLTAQQFVSRVNTALRTGGLEYSTNGQATGATITPEELGWWPNLLC